MDKEFELIVQPGKRPLWKTLLSAVSFTLMFYYLYKLGQLFYYFGYSDYSLKVFPSFVKCAVYFFVAGFTMAVMKSVLIDLDKDKLVSRFYIGLLSWDKLSMIPELKYVCVFKDSNECYQVNLWYSGNKHYKMYQFDTKAEAFDLAKKTAITLKIDLLDSTERGNFKWIDLAL